MDTAKQFPALTADHYLRKHMIAAETVFLSVRADLYRPAVHKFVLHPHKNLFRDNRFVVVLNIILRHNAVVLYPLFGRIIHRVGLLVEVTGYMAILCYFSINQECQDNLYYSFDFPLIKPDNHLSQIYTNHPT